MSSVQPILRIGEAKICTRASCSTYNSDLKFHLLISVCAVVSSAHASNVANKSSRLVTSYFNRVR